MKKADTIAILIFVFVMFIAYLIYIFAASALPAGAQTVTPLPGPVATQQAAQQKIDAAQQQQQAADALAQQAAQQSRQARDALNAARQDYISAQAAIQAQQVAVANDMIAQGNLKIQSALDQINQLTQTVVDHQSLVSASTAQHISDTLTIQALMTDKQTILSNYNAVTAQLETEQNQPHGIDASWLLVAAFVVAMVAVLIVAVVSQRSRPRDDAPPSEPPIDAGYTVTDDEEGEAQ